MVELVVYSGVIMHTHVVIFTITISVCFSIVSSYHARNRDSTGIDKLNRRLDILENELKSLISDEDDPLNTPPKAFAPLTVTQELTKEGILYTLNFKNRGDDHVTVVWFTTAYGESYHSRQRRDTSTFEVVEKSDVARKQSRFLLKNDDKTSARSVSFLFGNAIEYYYVELQSVLDADANQSGGSGNNTKTVDLKLPTYKLSTSLSEPMKYAANQNVTINMKRLKRGERTPGSPWQQSSYFQMVLLNLTTSKFGLAYDLELEDKVYEKTGEKEYFSYVEDSYVFNTAEQHIAGLVSALSDSAQNDDVVRKVTYNKYAFSVYPSNQPDVFPQTFLSSTLPNERRDQDGDFAIV